MTVENDTVWVVVFQDYDDVSVEGICVSHEAARVLASNLNQKYGNYHWIREMKLDYPLDPKPWAYALLGGDAETAAREAEQVTGGFVFWPRKGFEQDRSKYSV